MNSSFKLGAPWQVVKERLMESNTQLTDDDLNYDAGHEEELLMRLEKKLKTSKENIRMLIESVSTNSERAG